MARRKLPRAFTSALDGFVLDPGELVYDQDAKILCLGDGETPGGRPLPDFTQLRNQITPEMFGAVADFNGTTGTDNLAAMTAAINAASAAKARLLLSGPYYCSAPISLVNKHIDWEGTADAGFVFGATAGVAISQADYTYATYIQNVDFYTTAQEPGTGLSVSYAAADSIGNRNVPRCFIDNVVARGWDILADGWTKGVYTKNVHAAGIGQVWAVGRRDLSAPTHRQSFGNMVAGLHYDSDTGFTAVPSDSILDIVHVYNAQDAVLISGEVEGLSVTACKLVGVWKGVVSEMDTARPGIQVYANHINYFDYGVDLYRQPQAQVFANLLYKFELSDGLSIGVRLRNCDLGHVGQNTHINSATDAAVSGQFDCVQIADSVDCRVDAQIAERASRIVRLTGGTQRCRVRAQTFSGTATYTNSPVNSAIVDETGNANFIAGRWASAKSEAVTITAGGANIVSVSTPINVRAGQRFRVDAILNFTKGGTGGNINYSVGKSAGSATVAFHHDATSFGATARPDAGTQASLSCSAEMTVLTTGDLQLTMAGISAGSDAAVVSGGAQLVITEVE